MYLLAWSRHVIERAADSDPIHRLRELAGLLSLWLHRAQCRHELSQLDEAQLRDVGLNPAMVRREAEKPFWQA